MSDGELVPFPRPPIPYGDAPRLRVTAADGAVVEGVVDRCRGPVHVFADLPGRCQCGEEWWNGDGAA